MRMNLKVNTMDVRMRLGDAIDPCHLATDLKPLSVTNAKNGAIPLSLTPDDTDNTCNLLQSK